MTSFELESTEPIFSGHVFSVERRHLSADGLRFDREIVTHPGAVAVLAIDDQDRLLLVRQFRAAVGERILEMPAGTLDIEGEQLEAAARRELAEEAGVSAGRLSVLGRFYNSPGYLTQLTTVFLGEDLIDIDRAPVGIEEHDIDVIRLPMADALRMIAAGEIPDAFTALAVLLAAQRRGG